MHPLEVHCSNCASGPDFASLAVAIVALGVALASLYLTTLRRADIQVEVTDSQLALGGWQLYRPVNFAVRASLFIYNSGAHGGLLEQIAVERFRYIGADPHAWPHIGAPVLHSPQGNVASIIRKPMEAGETLHLTLECTFADAKPADGHDPVVDLAERLHGLEAVELDVVWHYLRGRRLPRFLGRAAPRKSDRTRLRVNADQLKASIAAAWAGPYQRGDAADVLTGTRSAASA
jgi:hypothetical protein